MSSIQSVLLASSLLLGQNAVLPASSLSPVSFRLAQANPNLPTLVKDQSQKMYGTLVWTTVRKSAMTRETSTHVVKGTFLRFRNTGACYEMPSDALVDGNITFRGFEGSVDAEVVFEDLERYPDTPPEEREQMIKRTQKRAVLPVRLTEQQIRDGNYFFQYGPTERVTMGCVTLSPKTGRFWIAPPWVNNMDSWVTPAHVNARRINQNEREMPYEPEAAAGYRFTPPMAFTEGRYDPKLETYTGSWSVIDPPTPGPDDDYVEHSLTWTLSYKEQGDVLVKGPKCGCKPNEVLRYKAETSLSGGSFEKFEVTADGTAPAILKNEGGSHANLELRGDAKTTGKTKIIAVYKDSKGKLQKSKALEVSFCELDKPELVKNPAYVRSSDKEAYMFDQGNPGNLEIDAKTKFWRDGKENASEVIDWVLEPDPERSFKLDTKRQGRESKHRAERLPQKNSSFGPKRIEAKLMPAGCECEAKSEPVKLRTFFTLISPGATSADGELMNNPGGKEPNWLYYYKQTPAWTGEARYQHVDKIPSPSIFVAVNPLEAARYDPYTDMIYITNRVIANGAPAPDKEPGKMRWYIDALATTMRHEAQHRADHVKWWGPYMARYPFAAKHVSLVNGIDPTSPDCDNDMVPNQFDCKTGCDLKMTSPTFATDVELSQRSCPSLPAYLVHTQKITDIEMNAYNVGWSSWKRGQANDQDWAWPGNQCDYPDCKPEP